MTEKKCIICGKLFKPSRASEKMCSPACQKQRAKDRYEKHKKEKNKAKPLLKRETLEQINEKARAAGMSYGKYMLQMKGSVE